TLLAASAASDVYKRQQQDRIENGEYRWQTIGLVHGIVVILVAHTIRFESGNEIIRIISARKADRKERSRYEHG
ncbi:BrnT family toxin, partial [Escherichia coli]|nr:BrnT family toxin [Escherichia coli]